MIEFVLVVVVMVVLEAARSLSDRLDSSIDLIATVDSSRPLIDCLLTLLVTVLYRVRMNSTGFVSLLMLMLMLVFQVRVNEFYLLLLLLLLMLLLRQNRCLLCRGDVFCESFTKYFFINI